MLLIDAFMLGCFVELIGQLLLGCGLLVCDKRLCFYYA